jgi:hypothetical protein
MYAALLGKAPACRLRGHEGLGHEEEQVARARDGEVHDGNSSGKVVPQSCGAVHMDCNGRAKFRLRRFTFAVDCWG